MVKATDPVPLTTPEAFIRAVRDRAAFHHMVLTTNHADEQMIERGVTRRMVLRVLARCDLVEGPHWDDTHASWSGKVSGTSAGVSLAVVCALRENDLFVTVVTTHRVSR